MATSVVSAASDIALLQSVNNSPSQPSEKSHSKSIYTFIQYEHSSHPPRYIILFFVIIFATIALGWLLAGLVRLRQTASYLESCASGKVQCQSNTNLTCSLISSLCLCPENQFWNEITHKCQLMRNKDQSCNNHQQCDISKGLICQTTTETCQCPSNTYYTLTGCRAYGSFGSPCNSSITPPCNVQIDLVCDVATETCLCPISTYWTRARCAPAQTYNGYCNENLTCNTQVGLFCRSTGIYPSCDCPLPSKLFTCDCVQGNVWVSSTGSNGTGMCVPQSTYMGICSSSSQCPLGLFLECINGVCDCNVPLSFWSWTLGYCTGCESQGYTLIRYQSQYVCTRLISASLMTYAASQSACSTVGWSLISPIFATDISVIAQAYPTYRVWMNMQSSLNNGTYQNNIFPTNQTNWNSYVSIGMNSVYSSYIYALQVIGSYSRTMMFEGNTNMDRGHAVCAYY